MKYSREFLASASGLPKRKQVQSSSENDHNKLFLVISYIVTLCMAYTLGFSVAILFCK